MNGQDVHSDNDWLAQNACDKPQTPALDLADFDLYEGGYSDGYENLGVDFLGTDDDSSGDVVDILHVSTVSPVSHFATAPPIGYRAARLFEAVPDASSATGAKTESPSMISGFQVASGATRMQYGRVVAEGDDLGAGNNDEGKQLRILMTGSSGD